MSSAAPAAVATRPATRSVTISPTTGKLRGPRIVISDPAKRRPRPQSYVPGQYDALIDVRLKDHLAPAELVGCSINLTADRSGLVITEIGLDRAPKHRLNGEPYYLELTMADGSSVQVEIRRFVAAAVEPGEPPADLGEPDLDPIVLPSPRTAADVLFIGVPCSHQ